MARPRRGEEKGATAGVAARIKPELKARLDAVATKNKRALTDEIVEAITTHVARQEKKQAK